MKLSIYQKLFSKLSTRTIFVLSTVVLWITISIPVGLSTYWALCRIADHQQIIKIRDLEVALVQFFTSVARYGDMINSKGTVLELGRPFGLVTFEICQNEQTIPPRPMHSGCPIGTRHKYAANSGTFDLVFVWQKTDNYRKDFFAIVLFAAFLTLLFVIFSAMYCLKIFKSRLHFIAKQISEIQDVGAIKSFELDLDELRPVTVAIRKLFDLISLYSSQISELKAEQYRAEIARQVAHDIRSPLSALKIATNAIKPVGAEVTLIRQATERISKIADDLIETSRQWNQPQVATPTCSILEAIQELISEKLLQFNKRVNLETNHFDPDTAVSIARSDFQRVISNLLNNACEALLNRADSEVAIYLRSYEDSCSITIADNGPGIPEHIISKLGKKPASSGKIGGSGLGLYHAYQTIHKSGGKIEIKSKPLQGTLITITLPRKK